MSNDHFLHSSVLNRPFQKRAWSCVKSYYSPLWGSHCHTLDTVNPANGYDVMQLHARI